MGTRCPRLACGKTNASTTRRVVVQIERVLGPVGLRDIDANRDLREEVLKGEGLANTDEWLLLKSWIAGWRRGDVDTQADFYVLWFGNVPESVI